MRRNRSLTLVAAALALFAILLFAVPDLEAICGDCIVILDQPECASPPANFAICRYFWEYEFYVIAGKIVRVKVRNCEGIVECAV